MDVQLFLLGVLLAFSSQAYAGTCPDNFWKFNQKCYHFEGSDTKTWLGAKDECGKLGAKLAEPKSKFENAFLKGMVMERGGSAAWLGGSDITTEGVWRWASDEENITGYSDWFMIRKGGDSHDCLYLVSLGYSGFHWDYLYCADLNPYICEKPVSQG